MKWKTNTRRFNDTGWRQVFAWTPKRCIDGYTRWLCFVGRITRFNGSAPVYVYRGIYLGVHHG